MRSPATLVYSPAHPADFPGAKTTDEMFDRAAMCVEANGGCAAMTEAYRRFDETEGSNVWRW